METLLLNAKKKTSCPKKVIQVVFSCFFIRSFKLHFFTFVSATTTEKFHNKIYVSSARLRITNI